MEEVLVRLSLLLLFLAVCSSSSCVVNYQEKCQFPTNYQLNETQVKRLEDAIRKPGNLNLRCSKSKYQTMTTLTSALEYRFESCALVGGSGNLLGSGFGPEIDSHEFVARVNVVKIEGYQSDVGTKYNYGIGWNLPTLSKTGPNVIIAGGSPRVLASATHDERVKACIDPPFHVTKEYKEIFGEQQMRTSGFWAVSLLARFCKHIDLYGFGLSACHPMHYYGNPKEVPFTALHPFTGEERFFELANFTTIHYPKCGPESWLDFTLPEPNRQNIPF